MPEISHGNTMPVCQFKTTYIKKQKTVTKIKFNIRTLAEVKIEAGRLYYNITTNVKYSSSNTTKETLETKGTSGKVSIPLGRQ
ncbi:hypothetical protein F4819DRAFT_453384 [Hypoxylon fuscum]|nr:hypothetical protein F4819DRAFT_453384 [Hypoxylon fuscum]